MKGMYLMALALALLVGLAACSSSDSGAKRERDEAREEAQNLQEQLDIANASIGELREELADLQETGRTEDAERISALEARIQAIEEETAEKEAEEAMKARSADANALKDAITVGGQQASTVTDAITASNIPGLDIDGSGTGTDNTNAITLKKGDAVASLGSWDGSDYAGSETGTKNTGMTRTYSNADAPQSHTFTSEAGEAVHTLQNATDTTKRGDYALTGTDTTGDPPVTTRIGGFPTTGTESYDDMDTVSGTYMGAAGTYTCVADAGCMSNAEGSAGTDLTAGWTFTPNAGASVQQKDTNYLHFGWWVRKDKDGPTHAGAFYGASTGLTAIDSTVINSADLVGEATYMGKAAGKFASSDPIRPGNDNSGHFTADAELMADFAATGSTLSGTIDNFRLNDGSTDPGWSVALQEASFQTDNKFRTGDTPNDDQTVWSIGGNEAAASGKWEAQMYNDRAKGDGNNTPHSVVGSFMSSIATTHEIVGAFGAERQ